MKKPKGIIKRSTHLNRRMLQIEKAIARYKEAGLDIPIEWMKEYNDGVTYFYGPEKPNIMTVSCTGRAPRYTRFKIIGQDRKD